ncbi:MAG: IS66 family insertion sequence element accessory protein TnpB [Candidatus Obscuribacterales bacterium]|nr:IS66 family insertion sequence element accessory protein TnpB [Candidatus Obscuribacterales bacterium]
MKQPQAFLHEEPINFRLSAEKLADLIRWSGIKLNSGDLFIFFNRKRDRCKIIWHDGEAFCTVEKRLDKGTFAGTDKINLTQKIIDNFFYDGIAGQRELLHALMGNVIYLDDARE